MNVLLSEYSATWRPCADGVWRDNTLAALSYPEDGHEGCFQLEDESFWFQHRNRVIAGLLGDFPPKGPFFDVGGGNGCLAKHLQSCGFPVVLVEPAASGVVHARQRGVNCVVQSLWSPHTVRAGTVPAVGLFDVVEHIENDREFLAGVATTLAPGGLLFMTVPAYPSLWSNEDVYAGHFRRYWLAGLKRLLKKCGFQIYYASYMFAGLPLPILMFRTIPSLLGLRRKAAAVVARREHSASGKVSAKLLTGLLTWEQNRIRRRQIIPMGSSCLAVASKLSAGVRQ